MVLPQFARMVMNSGLFGRIYAKSTIIIVLFFCYGYVDQELANVGNESLAFNSS
jgi:hypothetical protein